MARTKIRTDGFNVSTIVKSILDATTAFGIQTILSLVPGTHVQAYNANLLDTTNSKTVTNKTINPPSIGQICDVATTYSVYANYDHVQFNILANITLNIIAVGRFSSQRLRLILLAGGGDRTITWGSGIFAATGLTLPTTLVNGKVAEIELLYVRASPLTWLVTNIAIEP